MPTLGQRLREERTRRGYTIPQLAEQTRIHQQYFEAIERDDIASLPGGFFYRSFVRQYARLLELPDSVYQGEIARSLEDEAAAADSRDTALPQRNIDVPPIPTGRVDSILETRRWLLRLGGLALIIVACGGCYQLWKHYKPALDAYFSAPAQTTPAPQPQAPKPAPTKPVEQPVQQATQPPAPAPEQPAQPPAQQLAAGSDVRVTVRALEMTWVGVWDGEKQLYADVIRAGETRGFGSARRLRMRLGNAGGVAMEWNGQEVVPLGPKGQVRTVEFRTDGYSVIQPPAPGATPEVPQQ